MPISAEDTQQIGLGILQRIAVREKARLQAHFLARLYQSPESDGIALCGSMALHGVYLHKRWSKDLDFEAPKDVALQFDQVAAQAGLHLERPEGWEDKVRSEDAIPYTFALPSAFYPEVAIGVEVFSRTQTIGVPERRDFTAASGAAVPVLVRPLAEMLGVKLGCMFRRRKALDFADFWFGLSSDPCLRFPAQELVRSGQCEAGDFTPPSTINTRLVLDKLAELQETWQEDLSVYLTQVPDFAQVQDDLSRWLPLFDTHARK